MIRIKSQQEGFRRCGVAHPGSWTEHPDTAFRAEELEALKAEPMLQVQTGADAEDSGGSSGGLTCKKLTGILTRMGVEVPKPPVKKADLEARLDKVLSEPAPAKGNAVADKPENSGEKNAPAADGQGSEA